MTRKMKAILVLFFAAEIVNSAKVGVLKSRIADPETQRDITQAVHRTGSTGL